VLDARSCISYLTIEHQGDINPALARRLGDWIFGCDVCQEVCPWNVKFAEAADDPVLEHDPLLARLDLVQLAHVTQEEFQARYGKTALSRPGAAGMRRNAQLALRFTAETAGGAERNADRK
jgi:epoxyqueuosine reductase